MHACALTYPPLRHLRREYEAPPPQVREQSLHAPQASQPVSLSSSERVVLEDCKTQKQQHLLKCQTFYVKHFLESKFKCRIHSSLQSISDVRFMNLNDQAFADLLTRKKHIFNVYCQLFSYQHSSKYLLLCSTKERNPYKFGRTWGWVNDDRIFIFGWTILFTHLSEWILIGLSMFLSLIR